VGASPRIITLPRNPEALAPGELTDQELADQLGWKINQVNLFKPTADRCDDLKAEMRLRCQDKPADQSAVLDGTEWRVKAGPRAFVTTIPPPATIHRMYRAAKKDFYAACSVALKAIAQDLGAAVLEKISKKEQSGARLITAVLLQKPAA